MLLSGSTAMIVVIREAPMKYKINQGNILPKATFLASPPDFFALLVLNNARTKVIGMMAKVRVSLTVVA